MKITLKDVRINRTRGVTEKTETSQTFRRVPDGYELGDVEIVFDIERAGRYLAEKALRNKTGRAKFGFAKAKVLKRRRFKEPEPQSEKERAEQLDAASADNKKLQVILGGMRGLMAKHLK